MIALARSRRPLPWGNGARTDGGKPAADRTAEPPADADACLAQDESLLGSAQDGEAKQLGARSLAICNAVGSQITRIAEGTLLTRGGPGTAGRRRTGVR